MKPRQLFEFNEPVLGRRLQLVRLGPEHAPYLQGTFGDDSFWNAYRHNQDRHTLDEKLVKKLEFEHQQNPVVSGKIEWLVQPINEEDNDCGIGFAALSAFNNDQRRAEFQLGIVDAVNRNPGTGLEASLLLFEYAFNRAGLNKLVSYVYANNEKSQMNTLALGFQQEGLLRAHFRMKGESNYLDVYQNGMLISEFRSNVRLAKLAARLLGRDITKPPPLAAENTASEAQDKPNSDLNASFQINP